MTRPVRRSGGLVLVHIYIHTWTLHCIITAAIFNLRVLLHTSYIRVWRLASSQPDRSGDQTGPSLVFLPDSDFSGRSPYFLCRFVVSLIEQTHHLHESHVSCVLCLKSLLGSGAPEASVEALRPRALRYIHVPPNPLLQISKSQKLFKL